MEGKRYAVLLCAEDSEYVRKKYGGYFGVFFRMLAEEGETWDVYKVVSGEFPEEDGDLDVYDGFVITGSCNDAHGNDAWIHRLITLIQKLDSMKKKILGICFGHQILCRALGGKVSRSPTGWDIGVRTITLTSSSPPWSPTSLVPPSKLSIIQCHRDEVREVPAKAEVIGWSEKTGVEMFRMGDHIMGIQGHPEYNLDILFHLIDRLVQRHLILEAYGVEARAKMVLAEPDREAWKKLCTTFLKSRS
ncbi:gamma-glutamyl peptidase 5-like [Neltuma alba]|uniref:gamma-glutamyl peptidase 5-like n=1 Tax=Neltuma alba TaxID=207710 RepID=UPI0010A526F3|nr:gamma-glutamyl peptidase 5-like [Prosopis alba]XP_028782926.1 gamma-glutamyl peptidase 5-like [Prosopis alba]